MTEIYLHSRRLDSIFELLGVKENDITYSLGWAFSKSPVFLGNVLKQVFPNEKNLFIEKIKLQEYQKTKGYTDVELVGPDVHIIIEAKRGWVLPDKQQLSKYADRIKKTDNKYHAIVVMSECSSQYADLYLSKEVTGLPIFYIGWKDIHQLANLAGGTHAEKRLMRQLQVYLRRNVRMQNQESNMVYVVSLGSGTPEWSRISWQDIVNIKRKYFHPAEGKWPNEPPNYIAFRYDSKLQSIHHVDSYEIVKDMHAAFPEINVSDWPPHYLYSLGEPIIPSKEVKTGKIYPSGRVWVMLDLLLTCDTIWEARNLTQKRQEQNF